MPGRNETTHKKTYAGFIEESDSEQDVQQEPQTPDRRENNDAGPGLFVTTDSEASEGEVALTTSEKKRPRRINRSYHEPNAAGVATPKKSAPPVASGEGSPVAPSAAAVLRKSTPRAGAARRHSISTKRKSLGEAQQADQANAFLHEDALQRGKHQEMQLRTCSTKGSRCLQEKRALERKVAEMEKIVKERDEEVKKGKEDLEVCKRDCAWLSTQLDKKIKEGKEMKQVRP
ncbi:hypothetical protein LTR37_014728 [Vermiconidia calcicola]|uniref:Uncharacterized protein n=1 Tax=Vermiconidia calcicola TaxID=1690605 RepID=A0ACC3MSU2_9PEZI|nr:hypothetical protein LTR37_014728 [Vermiconidia calcicola]